jgi:NADPH:quinone reductase-like Zn-dependent oxidoreductase
MQVAGTTAWMAINGMRPLGKAGGEGEYILVQGTGGVSIMGLLIGKASGAKSNARCSAYIRALMSHADLS